MTTTTFELNCNFILSNHIPVKFMFQNLEQILFISELKNTYYIQSSSIVNKKKYSLFKQTNSYKICKHQTDKKCAEKNILSEYSMKSEAGTWICLELLIEYTYYIAKTNEEFTGFGNYIKKNIRKKYNEALKTPNPYFLKLTNGFIRVNENNYIILTDLFALTKTKRIKKFKDIDRNNTNKFDSNKTDCFGKKCTIAHPEIALKVFNDIKDELEQSSIIKKFIEDALTRIENENENNDCNDIENKNENSNCNDIENVEEKDKNKNDVINFILTSNKQLILNGVQIIARQSDGFINLNQLCKAGGKQIKRWKENEKSKAFLEDLSTSIGKTMDEILTYETGSNENRATWGHPHIAIYIAQWISPNFAVQVSKWVFQLQQEVQILKNKLNTNVLCENNDEVVLFKLKLLNNEILPIQVRKDGCINATQLCKAGNKLIGHFLELKQTKEYLQALSSNIGIPILKLITANVGGEHSGTWVHRKVAYHLAQWVSPYFAVQVTNWLDELLLTGKVELGKEKSNEELDNIYKSKFDEIVSKSAIPFYGKDVIYIYNFLPVGDIDYKYKKLLETKKCFEFGVSSDIEERNQKHRNDKTKNKPILVEIFKFVNRYTAAKVESDLKKLIIDLELKFEYKNKVECFMADNEELNYIIKKLKDLQDVKIEDTLIENKMPETKIVKENENSKLDRFTKLFEDKKITFEQYIELLERFCK
jgi:predicted GIY-YIG superfamily endonuclease